MVHTQRLQIHCQLVRAGSSQEQQTNIKNDNTNINVKTQKTFGAILPQRCPLFGFHVMVMRYCSSVTILCRMTMIYTKILYQSYATALSSSQKPLKCDRRCRHRFWR